MAPLLLISLLSSSPSMAPGSPSDKSGGLRYTTDRDFTLHGEIMLLLLVLLLAAFLVSAILFLWVKQLRIAASTNYDSHVQNIDAAGDNSAASLFHTQLNSHEFGRVKTVV